MKYFNMNFFHMKNFTCEIFPNYGIYNCHCKFSVQAFETKTYPVQTNQGKWIKEVIDFHVKGILKSRVSNLQS